VTRRLALVGRQNSGKTSTLMHLTGSAQRPVNFPGTSVERVEASVVTDGTRVTWIDLPGLASTSTSSPDEAVTLEFLRSGLADALCVVMDASKLSVELRLLQELAVLELPLVVALTKEDVALERGERVDIVALNRALGVEVVSFNGRSGEGADELSRRALVGARALSSTDWNPEELSRAVIERHEEAGRPTRTERIDDLLLHPIWGLPLFVLILLGIFELLFVAADPLVGWIESGQGVLGDMLSEAVDPGALRSLLVDGLIAGVGSILVFLPQIVILVFFIAMMETSGYMARVAFLLDRPLSRVGLSGRSFIPMFTSFACAVPGILATRMITDERSRIATIVTAPLMSCSARLPVYVLLLGAFFPAQWAGLVLFGLYALGVITAVLVAWLLRRCVLAGGSGTLMMELPNYQRPNWRVVGSQVSSSARAFIRLAGTVIFAASMLIWLTSYYPRPAVIHEAHEAQRRAVAVASEHPEEAVAAIDALEASAYLEQSWLATAGKTVQPIFALAGFDWKTSVGILAAFPARELVVPTLGILYSVGEVDPGDYDVEGMDSGDRRDGLREALRASRRPDGTPAFSAGVALSLMVFFALCSQCAGTLAAIRRETHSWRWPVFTFSYMTVFAWVAAVVTYQVSLMVGLS
jgi:ferrous iron transport protein B